MNAFWRRCDMERSVRENGSRKDWCYDVIYDWRFSETQ